MVGMSGCSADMAVAEGSATSVGSDPLVTGGLPKVREVRRVRLGYQMSAVVLCSAYSGAASRSCECSELQCVAQAVRRRHSRKGAPRPSDTQHSVSQLAESQIQNTQFEAQLAAPNSGEKYLESTIENLRTRCREEVTAEA